MSLYVCLGNAGIVLKKVLVSSKYLNLKKLTFITFIKEIAAKHQRTVTCRTLKDTYRRQYS